MINQASETSGHYGESNISSFSGFWQNPCPKKNGCWRLFFSAARCTMQSWESTAGIGRNIPGF
jgi:hypothetical protein